MTRVIAAALVLSFASVASADPPADKKAEPTAKKAEPAAKKQKKQKAANLQVKQPLPARIDLFPTAVMQKRSRTERERRMTLGDDGNWKVQAAQVGAMVGIFGALVGLCGGAKCLMPKQVTDALPSWMRAEHPTYSNPRRQQTVRKAR